jgi:hypothetical protein
MKEEFEMQQKVAALEAEEKTIAEYQDDSQINTRLIGSIRIKEGPPIAMAETMPAVGISHVQQDVSLPKTFQTKGRHSSITAKDLSDCWGISIAQAAMTLKATTQKYMQSALMPLARRYQVDQYFEQNTFRSHVYSDTMDRRVVSVDGNRCGQVFATNDFFYEIYPMATKDLAGEGLKEFISDYGVPELLTFDGSKEQGKPKTGFMKQIKKHNTKYHVQEPHRSYQNAAKGVIHKLR